MNVSLQAVVPPRAARAFVVAAGWTLRIVDVSGRQAGDLVALKADDLSVKLSQARTRVENGKVALSAGDSLWTNTLPPRVMATITRDTFGSHDLLYPPCCRYALEKRFGVSCDGCLEHLAQALAPWGVQAHAVPDPLNLFFAVGVDDAGRMAVREPHSQPGSVIELRMDMDCIVAVSTCAVPQAGREHSAYHVQVLEP